MNSADKKEKDFLIWLRQNVYVSIVSRHYDSSPKLFSFVIYLQKKEVFIAHCRNRTTVSKIAISQSEGVPSVLISYDMTKLT